MWNVDFRNNKKIMVGQLLVWHYYGLSQEEPGIELPTLGFVDSSSYQGSLYAVWGQSVTVSTFTGALIQNDNKNQLFLRPVQLVLLISSTGRSALRVTLSSARSRTENIVLSTLTSWDLEKHTGHSRQHVYFRVKQCSTTNNWKYYLWIGFGFEVLLSSNHLPTVLKLWISLG